MLITITQLNLNTGPEHVYFFCTVSDDAPQLAVIVDTETPRCTPGPGLTPGPDSGPWTDTLQEFQIRGAAHIVGETKHLNSTAFLFRDV